MDRITLFRTTPRIIMGPGALNKLAEEVSTLKAKKVLIVTDKGVAAAGIIEQATAVLVKAQIAYAVFDEVQADPRYEIAQDCTSMINREKVDLVIGIGGGSAIDIAKTAAVMATNKGALNEFFGIDLIPQSGLDTIIIPTTAGTGSEVTPIVILSDEKEKLKKGIVSPHLFPKVAILDPVLTRGLPPQVTAATGMDSLIHAVEAFTSQNAYWMTDMLAREAIRLIVGNIRTAFANGSDLDARSRMLEGSLIAGMAFANAGVTAVHAFAYPIGAEFHIPHGVANSIMLAPVMEFNMLGNLKKFAELAELLGENTHGMNLREKALTAVNAIRLLSEDLEIPKQLGRFGVKETDIPMLAEGVMKVTRLLANNPRMLTKEDAERIYRSVL